MQNTVLHEVFSESPRERKGTNMIRVQRILLTFSLVMLISCSSALAAPTLKNGSHGHNVLLLQQKLDSIGYKLSALDGVFGSETEAAVSAFQKEQSMKVTGVVNNATWRALKSAKKRKKPVWGYQMEKPSGQSSAISSGPSDSSLILAKKYPLSPNNKPILEKSKVSALIATAKQYIGVPYQFGGTTPKGFDCSGYLQYVFAKNGMNIPRLADDQYNLGLRTTSIGQLEPGDLVFFTTYTEGVSHCGIYLGNGEFIHTSSSRGVRVDSLSAEYWKPRYVGGKHIVK